jgi:hypothetical protein
MRNASMLRAAVVALLLGGCGFLLPKQMPPPEKKARAVRLAAARAVDAAKPVAQTGPEARPSPDPTKEAGELRALTEEQRPRSRPPASWELTSPYAPAPPAGPAASWLEEPKEPALGSRGWAIVSPYAASAPAPRARGWDVSSPYGAGEPEKPPAPLLAAAPSEAAAAPVAAVGTGLTLTSGVERTHEGSTLLELSLVAGSELAGKLAAGKGIASYLDILGTFTVGSVDTKQRNNSSTRDSDTLLLFGVNFRFPFLKGWFKPFFEIPIQLGLGVDLGFLAVTAGGVGALFDIGDHFGFALSFDFGGSFDTHGDTRLTSVFYWAVFLSPQFRF